MSDPTALQALQQARAELREVRHALQFANDNPGGGISDTLWMMEGNETVFDAFDAAIEKFDFALGGLPAAAPTQQPSADKLEQIIDDYLEGYEMVGETEDGRDACHQPTEGERILIKDAILGLLGDDEWDAEWGRHIAALATSRGMGAQRGSAGDAVARMPTDAEFERWAHSWDLSGEEDFVEHAIRKFCEVNGIRLAGDAACLNKGDSVLLEQGAGDKSLVHPAANGGNVASPAHRANGGESVAGAGGSVK